MNYLIHFMMMLSLLTIVSCGAKKSGATLKVSSSYALSNGSYEGGLVFFGRSSSGKFFSAPIAYGSGSNQITLDLDRGTWTFGAIGWKNDPDALEGDSECAVQSVSLDQAEQTVVLDLNTSGCANSIWGGNFSSPYFDTLALVTCGTFYTNSTSLTELSSANMNYCLNSVTALASDMKIHAKSAIVKVPAHFPGNSSPSPLTRCINMDTDGKLVTSLRLPKLGLPLVVELFETTCSDPQPKLLNGYVMHEGYDFNYPNFDKKVFGSSPSQLYLLASISGKGTSGLMASMPKFVCDGSNPANACAMIPYANNSVQRVVRENRHFFVKNISGTDTCADLSTAGNVKINSSNLTFNVTSQCQERDGKFFISLPQADLSPCTASCSLDLVFASGTTNLTIMNAGPYANHVDAYEQLFRVVGHKDILPGVSNASPNQQVILDSLDIFQHNNDSDDNTAFGLLGDVREFFRPDSIGGFFGQYSSSELNSKSINVTLWEDGEQKMYRFQATADTSAVPDYISNNTDVNSPSGRNFTHRITISRILGGAFILEGVTRFIYGEQVGMHESKHDEVEDSNTRRIERRLMFWNTESANDARFEQYNYEQYLDNSNPSIVKTIRTNFTRAERVDSANNEARIDSYDFESYRDGGSYDERSHKSSIILNGSNMLFKRSHASVENVSIGTFFTDSYLENYRKDTNITAASGTAVSPNGNHKIIAWAEYDAGSYDLKVIIKSNGSAREVHYFEVNSTNPFTPKVSINNFGEPVVAFTKYSSGTYFLYGLAKVSGVWKDVSGTTISTGVSISFSSTNIHTHTSPIPFDLLDTDPASGTSGSMKVVIYHDLMGNLKSRTISGGSWAGSSDTLTASLSYVPIHMKLLKKSGTYYLFFPYISSGSHYTALWSGTSFGTNSFSLVGNTSSFGSTAPDLFWVKENATSFDIYAKTPVGMGFTWNTNGTTLSGAHASISGKQLDYLNSPHCSARSLTTSQQVAISSVAGCQVSDTSFANPVRGEFKGRIEDLKPSNMAGMFAIP